MPPEKQEIFKSLENWATQNVLPLLKPVKECWQPQTFLPDPALPLGEFNEQVKALRQRTADLPDEYFVVLVGDMITEEALPTYQTMINTLDGVRDDTGASSSPWAIWTRAWTAEENRHGDLLKTFLYLSGRVDMLMIERTVQYLIGSGMVSFFFNNFNLHTRFRLNSSVLNHSWSIGNVIMQINWYTALQFQDIHHLIFNKEMNLKTPQFALKYPNATNQEAQMFDEL